MKKKTTNILVILAIIFSIFLFGYIFYLLFSGNLEYNPCVKNGKISQECVNNYTIQYLRKAQQQ